MASSPGFWARLSSWSSGVEWLDRQLLPKVMRFQTHARLNTGVARETCWQKERSPDIPVRWFAPLGAIHVLRRSNNRVGKPVLRWRARLRCTPTCSHRLPEALPTTERSPGKNNGARTFLSGRFDPLSASSRPSTFEQPGWKTRVLRWSARLRCTPTCSHRLPEAAPHTTQRSLGKTTEPGHTCPVGSIYGVQSKSFEVRTTGLENSILRRGAGDCGAHRRAPSIAGTAPTPHSGAWEKQRSPDIPVRRFDPLGAIHVLRRPDNRVQNIALGWRSSPPRASIRPFPPVTYNLPT